MQNIDNQGHIEKQVNNPTIQGDLIMGGAAKKLEKWLTQQPPKEPAFFGDSRNTELAALHTSLFEKQENLMLINGMGGVGKSSLALSYLHRFGVKAYAHLAWIEVKETLKMSLVSGSLKEALGLKHADFVNINELHDEICRVLGNIQGRNLLVFDDANDAEDIRLNLPNLSNWTILCTSSVMNPIKGVSQMKIDTLSPDKAQKLFTQIAPKAAKEMGILDNILQQIGYHTLTTELLAKNFDAFCEANPRYCLQDLFNDLTKHGLLHLKASTVVSTDYRKFENEKRTEDIIRYMYALTDLTAEQSQLLLRIAFLPPQYIPLEPLLRLCATLPDADDASARLHFNTQLIDLAKLGWLDKELDAEMNPQYKMHQIVQTIVLETPQSEDNTQLPIQPLIAILEDEYLPLHDKWDFAGYAGDCLKKLKIETDKVAELAFRLGDFNIAIGQLSQCEQLIFKSYEIYNNLDNKQNASVALERLGDIHQAQGNFDDALRFFEKDLALTEELYKDNPRSEALKNGLAISYFKLGELYELQKNYTIALSYFKKTHELLDSLYQMNPKSANIKDNLAESFQKMGDMEKFNGNINHALSIYKKSEAMLIELFDKTQLMKFEKDLKTVRDRIASL